MTSPEVHGAHAVTTRPGNATPLRMDANGTIGRLRGLPRAGGASLIGGALRIPTGVTASRPRRPHFAPRYECKLASAGPTQAPQRAYAARFPWPA